MNLYSAIAKQNRRSQGMLWVHLHPQGGEKILSVIYGEHL